MTPVVRGVALFGVFFGLAAGYAALLGGFGQEFLSDGAIHYVTTVVARDYLAHGALGNPLAWLDDYYQHYPLAGFGLWPPIYYGLSGLWTLLFGASRESMVMLSAAMAAAGCATLAGVLWRRAGPFAAVVAGLVLLAMPAQSSALRTVLIDPLCGLLCFLAALAFAKYLESRSTRPLLLFVLTSLAAIFTKGNGLLLAFLPPLAILFTAQWTVLRDWRLWVAGVLIGAIAAPWYLFTAGFTAQGFRYAWGLPFVLEAVPANARLIYEGLGPVILAPVAMGLWSRCRGADALWWRSLAALALACFLFQSIVPAALNLRYLFTALFPLAAFAAAGIVDIARATARPRAVGAGLAIAALGSVLILGFRQVELVRLGIAPVAAAAARAAAPAEPILIATSGLPEAGLIAELALADPDRPSFYAVRGSRLLGTGGYYATDYIPRFRSSKQVGAMIDRLAPSLVIVETSAYADQWGHIAMVREVAAAQPDRWRLLATFPGEQGRRFELYRLAGATPDVAFARSLNANPVLSSLAK